MALGRSYGIDVSYYQGEINWQAVKAAGVEWVILRGGFGVSNVDTQFINNITGAYNAGITQIGVYWFSYARDAETARTEAAFALRTIRPYAGRINLPVWFDWEEASYTYVKNQTGHSLTAAEIQDIGTAWCRAVEAEGYTAGIYSNKTNASGWFKTSSGAYLWDVLGVEFWYARYGANNERDLFVIPAFESIALSEHPETNILQFSDVGIVSGINSQRVDLNIRYVQTPEPEPPEPEPEEEPRPHSDSIEYVEIRGNDTGILGILDTAKSIIWHSVYYGVGDFEIYTQATPSALDLIRIGRYITRPNDIEIGVVESVTITDNVQDGKMLIAVGRFCKSILDRRHIYNLNNHENDATTLYGNVESEIRSVVSDNAISCAFDSSRDIPVLELGPSAGIPARIVDENGNATTKQVSFQNLMEYTDGVLHEYGLAAMVILDAERQKLQYVVYAGTDRSAENDAHIMPVIFSREFDNLNASTYIQDQSLHKNVAFIGGEGEGLERFYSVLSSGSEGLNRRETWVDAGSLNRKYKDGSDVEQTYTDEEYDAMLKAQGKQIIAELPEIESFSGEIDITNGNYIYNRDFSLGDIVTVQDNDIGKFSDVRITEVTEVQDENGYIIEAKYETE